MSGDNLDANQLNELFAQSKPPAGASGPEGLAEPTADAEANLKAAMAGLGDPRAAAAARQAKSADAQRAEGDLGMATDDVEFLLQQAELALASVNEPVKPPADLAVQPFRLQDFGGAAPSGEVATLALIRDVELDVKIELGRTQMYLDDVLKLHKGSVVALDKLAGDPVDIFVNGRLIARGEVLVLNDNFCVRVAELITGETPV